MSLKVSTDLGPVFFRVNKLSSMKNILKGVFNIKEVKAEGRAASI